MDFCMLVGGQAGIGIQVLLLTLYVVAKQLSKSAWVIL